MSLIILGVTIIFTKLLELINSLSARNMPIIKHNEGENEENAVPKPLEFVGYWVRP